MSSTIGLGAFGLKLRDVRGQLCRIGNRVGDSLAVLIANLADGFPRHQPVIGCTRIIKKLLLACHFVVAQGAKQTGKQSVD